MLTTDGCTFFTSAAMALVVVATGVTVAVAAGGVALSPLSATATIPPATEAPTRAPRATPTAKRPALRSRVRWVGATGARGGSNAEVGAVVDVIVSVADGVE